MPYFFIRFQIVTRLTPNIRAASDWLPPAVWRASKSCAFSCASATVILEADGQSVRSIEIGREKNSYQGELEHFLALIAGQEQEGVCTPRSCLESVEICYRIRDSAGD